jgi:Leucine-rich repeat (LRR) protein
MLYAGQRALTRTHRLKLGAMDLTEVPSELYLMKNLKRLHLSNNKLCSLPSEIAQLKKLDELRVRRFALV